MADGYEIDLDRAPQILVNLREARNEIQTLITEANALARTGFRGADGVSSHATTELRRLTIDQDQGSLFRAVEAYRQAIDDQVVALETALKDYGNLEEINKIDAVDIEDPVRPTRPAQAI